MNRFSPLLTSLFVVLASHASAEVEYLCYMVESGNSEGYSAADGPVRPVVNAVTEGEVYSRLADQDRRFGPYLRMDESEEPRIYRTVPTGNSLSTLQIFLEGNEIRTVTTITVLDPERLTMFDDPGPLVFRSTCAALAIS